MKVALILPEELKQFDAMSFRMPDGTNIIEIAPKGSFGSGARQGESLEGAGEKAGRILMFNMED